MRGKYRRSAQGEYIYIGNTVVFSSFIREVFHSIFLTGSILVFFLFLMPAHFPFYSVIIVFFFYHVYIYIYSMLYVSAQPYIVFFTSLSILLAFLFVSPASYISCVSLFRFRVHARCIVLVVIYHA